MAKNTLIVPIHADGRYVAHNTVCASPRLDFSRLPYFDGKIDINPYTPYLGEELEAIPFKDGAFELGKGVHLHWALPDFLTRSFRYPMLDLGALRRALAFNRLGEQQIDNALFDNLHKTFLEREWVKEIPGSTAYASILAEAEQMDIAISQMLVDPDPTQKALGEEILRVRHLLEPGGTQMPPVPNRWRVIRMNGDIKEQEWLVESDFLRPADKGNYQTGVPFPRPVRDSTQAPFGWLGRQYTIGQLPADEGEYLGMPLTTLGYGEPAFAAFYPDCHSVFGLYDDTAEAEKTYTYEIYGYYDAGNSDYEYLDIVKKDLSNRTEPGTLNQALTAFYTEELKLDLMETADGLPGRLVCCGRIALQTTPIADSTQSEVTVTIGSTSTEAVSAYLADRISKDKKIEVEEYLESLQFLSRLEHLQTDIGPKLREERHRQGFSSEKGGYRWVLAPRQVTTGAGDDSVQQVTLVDDQAHFLHELNTIQLDFDRTDEQIKALRQQIFADWSKFMLCQYPPDGADDDYPDTDQARFFIENNLMPRLNKLNAERQQLAKVLREHVQSFWHFRAGDISSPAGLFQKMWENPSVKPWLGAAVINNEAELVDCLNRFIDNKGYTDTALDGQSHTAPLSLEEILERQAFDNHLLLNRLELEGLFPDFLPKHPDFILKRKPHRSFHRPVDPVVLLTGDALKTTRKHGKDGFLPTQLTEDLNWTGTNPTPDPLRETAKLLIPQEWQTVPDRHPLLLDWLVEFFPMEDTDFNLDAYTPEYILDKYALGLNAVDLKAKKEDLYSAVGQTFWGSALLTSGGGKSLEQSLETFLIGELNLTDDDFNEIATHREAHFQADVWMQQYAGISGNQAVTPGNFDAFYAWAPPEITPANLNDLWTSKHRALALLAYEKLRETNFLSQALGGFTPAMLMLRQGYQLKIDDPLGYPEYQAFSRRVNEAVGLLNHASTLPNNPFFPIRAGAASLLELRLLDTFGQEILHLKEIPRVTAAETILPQHSHHHFELSPRLSQAARLSFHWLSANDDLVEQNEHPAASPICGWVLLNYLDESLMIYDQYGEALGYLDREGHWQSFPGHTPAILAEGIPNWHLRRMVLWLMKKARQRAAGNEGQSDTVLHFIELIVQALQTIEPPRADHAGEGVAMLMSRPLALVRAVAQLELKGLPAVHQGWQQFKAVINDPEGIRESTLDIEQVAFPLRIGENHQLNDGLIGFWEDAFDGEAYEGDTFRIPALNKTSDDNQFDKDDHTLDTLTIGATGSEGRRIALNLLMDPHGSVHATCGILPVQALELPKDIYYEALQRLEVSFLTAPLITPRQTVHLSLPNEPGFQWSWIGTDKRLWREISTVGHFRKRELLDEFGETGETLWQELLDRQWITLQGDQAVVVPTTRRPPTEDFPPATLAPKLEHFLESRIILPFQMIPSGHEGQEIREGWLKLRPAPELPTPAEEIEEV
jgi:hypothetical protein